MAKIQHRPLPALTEKEIARFWSKVDKCGPDECWLWTGTLYDKDPKDRYPHFHVWRDGRIINLRGARVLWLIVTGEDPGELLVRHDCDNPPCVNPRHLQLGTALDNNRDRAKRNRNRDQWGDRNSSRLHPESIPRGARRGSAKLTDEFVREIRVMVGAGITQRAVARQVGVSQGIISEIVNRARWSHVE